MDYSPTDPLGSLGGGPHSKDADNECAQEKQLIATPPHKPRVPRLPGARTRNMRAACIAQIGRGQRATLLTHQRTGLRR